MILAELFDFREACGYVEDLGRLGSRPGMERIRALCRILGDPQDDLRFIHIAGTNGKGSTAAMISSVLTETGLRTGMYYSPAMIGITDHYMADGKLISDEDYSRIVSIVADANEKLIADTGESATQFEFETAVAFVYFSDIHCDAVVLECGMGGRDDATNIVTNKICCVFASISFDHMQYLGNSLFEIADVKSGIITSDCPVIAFDSSDEATSAIRNRCSTTGSRLYLVSSPDVTSKEMSMTGQTVSCKGWEDVAIGLPGTFQAQNAALALKAVSVIRDNELIKGCDLSDETIREGMKKARWPYRFECIKKDPLIITDGAHNEDAAKKLADSIRSFLPGYELILVIGVFADKEYKKVIKALVPLATAVITTETPDNPRALPAGELGKCAAGYCKDVSVSDSIRDAYERAVKKADTKNWKTVIVACGSLSYLKLFSDIVSEDENGQG